METVTVIDSTRIENELVKHNLTDSVLAQMRDEYLPLKINGITDRQGYKKVKAARLKCKNTRILAEKICKRGREAALIEQRAWIAKEKEVCTKISEVEEYLEKQETEIDAAREAKRLEDERIERERIQKRVDALTQYGAAIDVTELTKLSDADFEAKVTVAKTMWEIDQAAKAKAKEEEDARQAKIVADQKAENDRLAEIDRQQKQKEKELKAEEKRLAAEKKKAEEPVKVNDNVHPIISMPNKIEVSELTWRKLRAFCVGLKEDELDDTVIVYSGEWYTTIKEAEFIHGEMRLRIDLKESKNVFLMEEANT